MLSHAKDHTYQLGSTSIAGHDALKGSSLRLPKLDGTPRGCINGSIKKNDAGVSQENVNFSFLYTMIFKIVVCLTRVERKCHNQVNVSWDRHVNIKYVLLFLLVHWDRLLTVWIRWLRAKIDSSRSTDSSLTIIYVTSRHRSMKRRQIVSIFYLYI
jgi:hypothetical protein